MKQLTLTPDSGLNIITGETGAGKSIMLGAVGLLLGHRADVKVLLDEEKKCVVEACFDISSLGLQNFFHEHDLDFETQTLLRREINPKGKSRAFVNDVPVTLEVMKKLGIRLIDIHSQHESVQLGQPAVRLGMMDDFAGSSGLLKDYQHIWSEFNQCQKKRSDLLEQEKRTKNDADFKAFLLEELTQAELKADEQEALEHERSMLENAEDIKQKLGQLSNDFAQGEFSVSDRLREARHTLRNLSSFSDDLNKCGERFGVAVEEIVDVLRDLSDLQEQVEHDPERIVQISQRLDLIYKLQQKHKVDRIGELLEIQAQLSEEATQAVDLEEAIEAAEEALAESKKKLTHAAERLSEQRRTHIDPLAAALNDLLKEVGMPNGHVAFAYRRVAPWKMGIDEVEMLFSANKGIAPEPVGRIASGGEFSRLMFCIKYLLSDKKSMPTVVFDEIDTGISGEIALKVAKMMRKMAEKHQLITITHLPQMAARGQSHYFVYKTHEAETTESKIKKLDEQERLAEIAQMIGGAKPSAIAMNSARELMEMN